MSVWQPRGSVIGPLMQALVRLRIRTLASALLASALIVAGCAGSSTPVTDSSTLGWTDCDGGECAVLVVPLEPAGATQAHVRGRDIAIDIVRITAGSGDQRRGVLLVNPGGPGGSGLTLARSLARTNGELADAFDIVGWEPRGVGESASLNCDEPLVDYYRLDNTPDTALEQDSLDEGAAAAAAACEAADADLLAAIGTDVVVDDMDAIRVALGEEQISYLGYSYGTMLGLVYAERYGEHLRAAVLDGVLDPTFTLEEWLTSQAVATEEALVTILERCPGCDGLATLEQLVAAADEGSLTAPGGLSPSDVTRAAILSTYDASLAERFLDAVDDALAGDGSALRSLSNDFLSLASFDVYTAVSCVDNDRPNGVDAFDAFVGRISAAAPTLGPPIANELRSCAFWSAQVVNPITELSDATAPPMLVLGNTGDSATPYVDAVSVTERLTKARLLTYEGTGHTSYGEGSTCVDDAVEAYLLDLVIPPPDTICR